MEDLSFAFNQYVLVVVLKRKAQKEKNTKGLKKTTFGVRIRPYFKAASPSERAVSLLGAAFGIQKRGERLLTNDVLLY